MNYHLLPFQFARFDENECLLVNESGEFHFMDRADLVSLIEGDLPPTNAHFDDLRGKQFMVTGDLAGALDMVATRYRTRKNFITNFTALHMLVLTVRCHQDCTYCQVSAESDEAFQYDMPQEVAERAVEFAFMSPSPVIKIEFQGGEPTLNWSALTAAVRRGEELNTNAKKHLEFVVCTNLTAVTKEMLEYFHDHKVCISTSLDGPGHLHDKGRVMRKGGGTYETFLKNLAIAREICGPSSVSALMTTTAHSVDKLNEVVDEYIRMGFSGIFLRSLNPYGLAAENSQDLGYSVEHFAKRYSETLDYIIDLNLSGTFFPEYFASLLLTRIYTPFSTGFVDLQSPSGAGISGVIYDYNGDVYPADEARMLSRMGDNRFLMGNVLRDTYRNIFGGAVLRELVAKSIVEIMPGCASCVYRTYCGADPVRNYLETGDIIGRRPSSSFCEKNKAIFGIIFQRIRRGEEKILDVFWSWITKRPMEEARG